MRSGNRQTKRTRRGIRVKIDKRRGRRGIKGIERTKKGNEVEHKK